MDKVKPTRERAILTGYCRKDLIMESPGITAHNKRKEFYATRASIGVLSDAEEHLKNALWCIEGRMDEDTYMMLEQCYISISSKKIACQDREAELEIELKDDPIIAAILGIKLPTNPGPLTEQKSILIEGTGLIAVPIHTNDRKET